MTRKVGNFALPFGRPSPSCLIASLGVLLLCAPTLVFAQSPDSTVDEKESTTKADNDALADRIQSVERKVFLKRRRFEIHPYFGLDLNDAFFQHFFVGGGVAYHLQDSFSLELRGGAVVADIEKGSVRFVRVNTESLLEGQLSLLAHGDLNATWAPLYGKLSLFGESILHFDTFIAAGGGIFVTERAERETLESALENVVSVNPAVNVAIGQRFYFNEWLVFRVELRNYSFIETGTQSDLQNVTTVGVALSGFFPMSFSYEYQ